MFCPSCGSALKVDGDRDILYCPYCGAELPDSRVSINRNYNTNNTYERKDINITNTKKEIDWTTIAMFSVMPILAIVIILIGILTGN